MKETKKVICVRVDEEQHTAIRVFCAKRQASIQETILKLLIPLIKAGAK